MGSPLALLFLAVQSAAPTPTTVLLTRRVEIPRALALEVTRAVSDAVAHGGLDVQAGSSVAAQKTRAAAEGCHGKPDCVLEAARRLGAEIVVGVQVGGLGSAVAVYVDAWRVSDGAKLAEHNTPISTERLRSIPGLDGFVSRLGEALAPPPPPPVVARPPPPVVVPPPPPPPDPRAAPPEAVAASPAAPVPSHTAGYAMTGVAAVAAVGAVACLAVGLALKAPFDNRNGKEFLSMDYGQAAARRDQVNALLVTSAVAGGVAVAAGGTALLVW